MSDIAIFLGRFHPLIVHLPIGFILLAAILEGYSSWFKDQWKGLQIAIKISLLASFVSSLLAVLLGFLLASEGGYESSTLNWHKWMGIVFCLFCLLLWLSKAGYFALGMKLSSALLVISLVAVSVTGHFGGNLTHGSDYLTAYAPKFLKGEEDMGHQLVLPKSADSILVYEHLIQPILQNKCYACHSNTKSQGGLNLSSIDSIQKGGNNGPVVHAGESQKSSLFTRVTLSPESSKFMPPSGEVLSYSELKLLQHWIDSGASFEARLTENEASPELAMLLQRDYNVDLSPKTFYELHSIPPLSKEQIGTLNNAGWKVRAIAENVNFLQVAPKGKMVTEEMLKTLLDAKNHVSDLDLGKTNFNDGMMKNITQFKNLIRLNLGNNPITSASAKSIIELSNLEVLNVYQTHIDDSGIQQLGSLKNLKKVYVWNSKVSAEGIAQLKSAVASLQIIGESM